MSRRTSILSLPAGESANLRWLHCKAQFEELAKSMRGYRLWLETTLNDSSPGSPAEPDSSSSPWGSRDTQTTKE